MKNVFKSVAACLTLLSVVAFAGSNIGSTGTLEERIKPVGSVCMSGEDCAAAPVETASAGGGARSGQQVFDTKCMSCHATGAAGAPKMGDAGAWEPRVGKGMDTLYGNAIKGFNGMPAKGLCFDCSDDEIKAAVDYMADGSK